MRYLENLNDTSVIKHGDSSETLRLSARNDNEPVTWSEGDVAEVHVDKVGKKVAAKLVVGSNNVLVDSGDLADLAAGKYGLELWVTLKNGKTAIWPSDGSLEMTIDKNSDEITGDTVTTITLEDLEKRVDDKISEGLKNIKLDPSKIPSVDLSGYAKKSDVPQVVYDKTAHTLTVNGVVVDIPANVDLSGYAKLSDLPHVDLTPYLTKTDADSKYAIKADVPSVKYDKNSRTLTVDGQVVSLPASVDLSDYAKSSDLAAYARKDSIPNVVLDVAKRTLSLNGATVTIPQSVDLSQYAKSSQVPSVKFSHDTNTITIDGTAVKIPEEVDLTPYAKSADVDKKIDHAIGSIPSVDLTDYVRKEDVADFARKTDIPAVPAIKLDTNKRTITVDGQEIDIPNAVDLSQYVKVDNVPKIALDTEKRTITVNGTSIDVPDTVNLDNYVTQSELTQKLATVSQGGKIDLTGYVTKADADETYAKKTDITGMLTKTEADQEYAKKTDIKEVDLTPYAKTADIDKDFAKKTDVPSVTYDAEKKTLSVNGQAVELPENVDLSGYAKLSDIPKVDLTPYIKTSDADAKYVAKSDLSDYAKTTDVNSLFSTVTGTIPQIGWDAGSRMLDINGTGVKIPESVDLTPYVKKSDADNEFAKKEDASKVNVGYNTATVTDISSSGSTTTSTFDLARYNDSTSMLYVGDSAIDIGALRQSASSAGGVSVYVLKRNLYSYECYTSNGAQMCNINNDILQGINGDVRSTDSLKKGDLVFEPVGRLWSVSTITTDNYQPVQMTLIGSFISGMLSAPTISQWQNSTDVVGLEYVPKSQLKAQLELNDDNAQYTLNMDTGNLDIDKSGRPTNHHRLMPGVYQLRDHNIDNLTILSKENYGLGDKIVGATPTQMLVTPYFLLATLVYNDPDTSEMKVSMSWRSCWLGDGSAWFGVTDEWHVMK